MSTTLLITPRISEKAYTMSQSDKQVVVFNVPTTANKMEVKAAVEAQFGVSVLDVKTINQTGKVVRTIRLGSRRGRPGSGQRSTVKKAYVTLKAGDRIPVFEDPKDKKKEAKK